MEEHHLNAAVDQGVIRYCDEEGWLRVQVTVGRAAPTEPVGARAVTIEVFDSLGSVNADALRAFPLGAWREQFNSFRMAYLGRTFPERVQEIVAGSPGAVNPGWETLVPSLEHDLGYPDVGDAEEVTRRFADGIGLADSDPARSALLELALSYKDAKDQTEWQRVMVDMKSEPIGRPRRGPADNSNFYRRLAERYRTEAAFSRSPARNIADAERVPVATVRTWLNRARAGGHLPPEKEDEHE